MSEQAPPVKKHDNESTGAGNPSELALAKLIKRTLPETPELLSFRRLSGGASQETWVIETRGEKLKRRIIMRRAPGGTGEKRFFSAGLTAEANLIKLAGKYKVPVPEVFHILEPSDALGRGYLMSYVEGETIARKILRDACFDKVRPDLARQCGDALAKIHSIPIDQCPQLPSRPARLRIIDLESQYRNQSNPRPVFEFAFQWLHKNMPPPTTLTLVHGDFRNGNLIIDENGIAAAIDWELAHFGDALEDLGLLCAPSWRFGQLDKEVGGFGKIDQLIAGYEAAGGAPVDRGILNYWIVFTTLFWGIACVEFALDFRKGDRAVERAAIGRRSSEAELDLLWLLDSKGGRI